MTDLMVAALELAESGMSVFPCIPNGKRPATTNGFEASTRNPRTIEGMWRRAPFNIGIDCGRSDLVVLDYDNKDGRVGGINLCNWMLQRGLIVSASELPDTLVNLTPSGGGHVYYRRPHDLLLGNSTGTLPDGVDVRGVGGYVLAPPSVIGRRSYSLHPQARTTEIADLPAVVLEALTPKPMERRPLPALTNGVRYGDVALDGECEAVEQLRAGERHKGLLRSAVKMGTLLGAGALPNREYVELRLLDAVSRQFDPYPERDALRDIRDGLDYGIERPRALTSVRSVDGDRQGLSLA